MGVNIPLTLGAGVLGTGVNIPLTLRHTLVYDGIADSFEEDPISLYILFT